MTTHDQQSKDDAVVKFDRPAGVLVVLDEDGDMPRLVVTAPHNVRLPAEFVRACHKAAGDNGATIEFKERG